MNNSFCVLALYLPIRICKAPIGICKTVGELNAQASRQHGWGISVPFLDAAMTEWVKERLLCP
ncbi:hypothetical protein OGZ01_00425 [Vibrio harveyi]|nr:hypothetical protein [Vibrio harveyi]